MDRIKEKKFVAVFFLVCTLVIGCAKKQPIAEPVINDEADTALSKAAEEIQRDLKMLNVIGEPPKEIQQGNLGTNTAYRFTGDLEDIVKDVGRRIGYKTEFRGDIPQNPIIVAIYSVDKMPWFSILEAAGTQAGNRANLSVDDRTKTLIVTYGKQTAAAPAPGAGKEASRKSAKEMEREKIDTRPPTQREMSRKLTLEKPQPNLLVYKGDIKGAAKKIADKMGYELQVVGAPKGITVNIESGNRGWTEIVDTINRNTKDAGIFISPDERTVFLQFEN